MPVDAEVAMTRVLDTPDGDEPESPTVAGVDIARNAMGTGGSGEQKNKITRAFK